MSAQRSPFRQDSDEYDHILAHTRFTTTADADVNGVMRHRDLMQDGFLNPSNAEYNAGLQSTSDCATGKAALSFNQNNAARVFGQERVSTDDYGDIPRPPGRSSIVTGLRRRNDHLQGLGHADRALEFARFTTPEDVVADGSERLAALPAWRGMEAVFSDSRGERHVDSERNQSDVCLAPGTQL